MATFPFIISTHAFQMEVKSASQHHKGSFAFAVVAFFLGTKLAVFPFEQILIIFTNFIVLSVVTAPQIENSKDNNRN
jgi:hypothetical protein